MKDKTIILDGVEYNLVPVEKTKVNKNSVTFYYSCISDCGFFEFSVLLNDDGEIWEGTQNVTYYIEGHANKNNSDYWDNKDFLIDVLEDDERTNVSYLRKNIGDLKFTNLTNLLQQVRKKGWI